MDECSVELGNGQVTVEIRECGKHAFLHVVKDLQLNYLTEFEFLLYFRKFNIKGIHIEANVDKKRV